MQRNSNNNKNGKNPNPLNLLPYIIVGLFLAMMLFNNPLASTTTTTLDYTAFNKLVTSGDIKTANVVVDYNTIKVTGTYESKGAEYPYTATIPNTEGNTEKFMQELSDKGVIISVNDANEGSVLTSILSTVLPLVGFLLIGSFFINKIGGASGNKQAFDFSKSRARLEDNIKIRFSDVAGCEEEKEEMAEIIDYLKTPRKFAQMGARIPKGILLVGPPGTGKTLLAKAVAGEANVPFYSISGSDFVEMFVGVGASRVRDMFAKAKKTAPCMIFIDEIDAVGRQRGAGMGGGHDEREQTLNQMLVEMDGMSDNNGVVVIAATNRPDVLDPALLRPGRFDRQITVSLPDLKGREEILRVHARNKKLDSDVDLGALARRTPGFSGADLENVLNEAAILSVRENKNIISLAQVDEAIDRVMMGPAKKSRTYDEHTKKLVAYHEAGHAIVGLNLPDGAIVQKVTIIPRGMAGGYTNIQSEDEKMHTTKNELLETICTLLAGRVSEQLIFDDITTGAQNDIERATKIARAMVCEYGMSELGPVQLEQSSSSVFLGRDYNKARNFSDQVAFEIDQQIRKIIDECYKKTEKVLKENRKLLDLFAENLVKYETLTKEQMDYLVEHGHMPLDEEDDDEGEYSLSELKEIAKEQGIKGYSKMNKKELEDAIKEE